MQLAGGDRSKKDDLLKMATVILLFGRLDHRKARLDPRAIDNRDE
jgi:hypothetical protein